MAFIDIQEWDQRAEDEGIVPHPLKDVLPTSKKTAYLRGLVFSGLVDDAKFQAAERKLVRARALSLDMTVEDFKEAEKSVQAIDASARGATLQEIVSEFKDDRVTSFFFASDFALAMASDGDLTNDAAKFIEGVYKFLNLSDADRKFLAAYRVFLSPGKMADAGELVHKATQEHFDLPDGFVRFFTPDLKPIRLKGGVCPAHLLSICSAKFQINEELIVPKSTTLVMKDSEIFFGRQGKLTLSGSKIEIRNCKFIVPSATSEGAEQSVTHFITGKDLSSLELTGCTFDGAMERGAVETDGTLIIKGSEFLNLRAKPPLVSANGQFTCTLSEFRNCQSDNWILAVSYNLDVTICRFELCKASSIWKMEGDGYVNAVNDLFDRCYASGNFCWIHNKKSNWCYLRACCLGETQHNDGSPAYFSNDCSGYRLRLDGGITRQQFEELFKNKGVKGNS